MNKEENKSPQDSPPTYLKYIGLSFQMITTIGLGTWLGWEIQKKSQINFPVWLLTFCFLSIVISFYQLFASLKNDEKEQQKNKKP